MILNDNLLESSISIKYLRDWLNEQEKGGASYINLVINDISQNDDTFDKEISGEIMDLSLDSIQLEAV